MKQHTTATSSTRPTIGSFAWGQVILARNGRLSRHDLAQLLEGNVDKPLPPDLREAAVRLLQGQSPRGRKPRDSPAVIDFILVEAIELYETALKQFQARTKKRLAQAKARGDILPRGQYSASERALRFARRRMQANLGHISTSTLRNLMSLWRRGRYPKSERFDGSHEKDI